MDITYCSKVDCLDSRCPRHQYNAPDGDISIANLDNGTCFVGVHEHTGMLREPIAEMLHIKDLADMEAKANEFDFETIEATKLCTSCLICGESVATDWFNISPKICDECKKAVMHIRSTLML